MDRLHLNIVSPEKLLFDGEVSQVVLPGAKGRFTILVHHAPIVSVLQAGRMAYSLPDGSEQTLDIAGGFVEMSNGLVSVCVETI